MLRNVTESQKRRVAGRQRFICAGNIPEYQCPFKGEPFDESGYEIDHIKELRDGGSNELSNLQALCIMCHRVKTNRNTSAFSGKKAEPREESHFCYHCKKIGATLFDDNKWSCQADCIRRCEASAGGCEGGCGPRSSPITKEMVARQQLRPVINTSTLRSCNWVVTINNPTQHDNDHIRKAENAGWKITVFNTFTQKKLHINTPQCRMSAVQMMFPTSRVEVFQKDTN